MQLQCSKNLKSDAGDHLGALLRPSNEDQEFIPCPKAQDWLQSRRPEPDPLCDKRHGSTPQSGRGGAVPLPASSYASSARHPARCACLAPHRRGSDTSPSAQWLPSAAPALPLPPDLVRCSPFQSRPDVVPGQEKDRCSQRPQVERGKPSFPENHCVPRPERADAKDSDARAVDSGILCRQCTHAWDSMHVPPAGAHQVTVVACDGSLTR